MMWVVVILNWVGLVLVGPVLLIVGGEIRVLVGPVLLIIGGEIRVLRAMVLVRLGGIIRVLREVIESGKRADKKRGFEGFNRV